MSVSRLYRRLEPVEWVYLLLSAYLIGRLWDLHVLALTSPLLRSLLLAVVYYLIAERSETPMVTLGWSLLVSLVALLLGPVIL